MLGEKARPVLDHIVEDVGHHIADADGVDPDAMLDRLQCQRAGQLRQRTLRSRIGGDGRKGEVRRIGGDIDDRPRAVGHHCLDRFAAMQESRSGIDRLDALPVLAGHVHHQLVDDDAGIVDQDVESAEALDRQAHRPLRGPVFGDVGLKRHQPRSSEFLDRRVDVFGNDLGTSLVQQQGDRLADTTGSASDQRDLACNFRDDAMLRIAHADSSGIYGAMGALVIDRFSLAHRCAPNFRWLALAVGLLRAKAGSRHLRTAGPHNGGLKSALRFAWCSIRSTGRRCATLTTQPLAVLSWSFMCLDHPTPRPCLLPAVPRPRPWAVTCPPKRG